jgi:peroxiredoxin
MSTTVHCPECNAPLELPDSIPSGKRLQCPDCGSAFSPPAETDRNNGLKTEPARAEGRGATGAATAPPRRRTDRKENEFDRDAPPRRGGSGSAVVLAAIVIILLLALGVGGAILLTLGRAVAVEEDNVAVMANPAPPPAGMMMGPVGPGAAGGMPPVGMGGPPMMGGAGGALLKVGDPAPEIGGEDLDGKPMKLSDFRGKVVVLDFWGDWCPFCQPTYTYQNHLIDRMKGEPFALLGVNSDDTQAQAQLVVKNQKIRWRSWYDGGGPVMRGPIFNNYGIAAIPTTFVIDKEGIIRKRFDIPPGEQAIDNAVDEVMAMGQKRPANVPLWNPGSTAFSQLGQEVAVGPYRMRPPAGFVMEKPDPKHEIYLWKGPKQPDGYVPSVEVSLDPAPPADKKLEDILETDLAAVPKAGLLGWSCSAAERGEVKGLTFARAHWSVMASPGKVKTAGSQFAAVDGDTLIRVSCRGVRPPHDGPCDAAPLTIRRAPAK